MEISNPGEPAYHPFVAVDPAGDAVAVWTASNGTNTIVQAASRVAGGNWQTPVEISTADENASSPRIEVDAEGNATAIWILDTGSNRIVQAASKPAGEGWQPPESLSPVDARAFTPELAVDADGNAVAVWRDDSSGKEIQAASKPAGWGWPPPVSLPGGDGDVTLPDVALTPDGNAIAIWAAELGDDEIVRTALRDDSGTWETAESLTTTGSAIDSGIAADDAGNAFAIWQLIDGTERVVQVADFSAVGGWGTPANVSLPADGGFRPAIAAGGNAAATATWSTDAGPDSAVQISRKLEGGWQAPVDISTPGISHGRPRVEVSANGDAIALWPRIDGSEATIQAARGPAGEAWGSPVALSAPSFIAGMPPDLDLGLSADGSAIAAWGDFSSSSIQASAYDSTAPELRSLSIPATGEVGERLSFSVSPFDAFSPLGSATWSFGDGSSAGGEIVTHAYSAAGDYTATVEVVDALGNVSRAAGPVAISAAPASKPPSPPTPPSAPLAPAPPPTADAKARRQLEVEKGKAILHLRCPRAGECRGVAELRLKSKGRREGGKRKRGKRKAIRIGEKRVVLDPGEKGKVRIKLNRRGRTALRRAPRGRLKAKLSGSAVESRSVILKRRRGG